jgi:hypothetical protein
MLKQNLDFFAVGLIVLVLGVVQAPRLGVNVARVAMEQRAMQMRNVRFEGPMMRVPVLPSLKRPPLPPLLCEKVLNYK